MTAQLALEFEGDERIPLSDDAHASGSGGSRGVTSSLRLLVRVFAENRLALVGLVAIVALFLFSFVGPVFYRTDQVDTNIAAAYLRPSSLHLLGTNEVGYDVLGRLMLGGQSSLEVGFAAALLATIVGTVWGALAGYMGGWLDAVLMRSVDSLLAIPPLLLVLLLASVFAPSVPVLVFILAMISWLPTARFVRAEALSLRSREFVEHARCAGAGRWRIIARHIIPNTFGTVVVNTTFQIANAILALAALSYLGLGPPPPAANWGQMLSDGLNYVYDGYWWLIYPPGLAIVITVVAFNLVGDALRDALEVRLQTR